MPIVSAEKFFVKGLEALEDRNFIDGAMFFRRAMDIETQRRVQQPDMRYLSYYGLCRAHAHSRVQEGLHACIRAARTRSQDPDMFLNLGRVFLMARQKSSAYRAFQAGLDIEPGHETLALESSRLARRLPRSVTARHGEGFFARIRSALSRGPQA